MAYWLIDPVNNVELAFDVISSIRLTSLTELKKYTSQVDNTARVIYSNPLPLTVAVQGMFYSSTASFTDYMRKMLYFDKCGEELLLIDGHNGQAYLGYLEAPTFGKSDETNLTLPFSFSFVMKGQCVGFMAEAEDALSQGPTITADANASEGYCIVCDALYEGTEINITQSGWKMPITNYRMCVRAKDTNQITDDLNIFIYNSTDSTTPGEGHKTTTSNYRWYSVDISLASDDVGDNLILYARKSLATANSISIDMIVCVST